MAHILIQSETDPAHVIKIQTEISEPGAEEYHFAVCLNCGDTITDRGRFQDTVVEVVAHVDHACVSHGSGA